MTSSRARFGGRSRGHGLARAGVALGALLAAGCAGTVAAQAPPGGRTVDAAALAPVLRAVVDMAGSQGTFQGVSVGVDFGDGSPPWFGAAGHRDIARTQPLSPQDQFRIGSHSKTFTGTVILQLLDQGKLGLDDTLTRWVPELKVPNSDAITIRHLLTMTSGLPDYLAAKSMRDPSITVLREWSNFTSPIHNYADANYTPRQLVEVVVNDTSLSYGPVGQMHYSNTNFALLGIIADKAGYAPGAPCPCIAETVTGTIIAPLGLKNTSFPVNRDFSSPAYAESAQFVMSGAAFGVPDNTSYDVTRADPQVPWAAGAVISNPMDELTWVRQLVLNDHNLLAPATQLQRLEAKPGGSVAYIPARYGMALYYMPSVGTGTDLIGHSGMIGGYTSSIFYSPTLNVGFAVNFSGLQANAASWFPLYGAEAAYGQDIREGGSLTSVPILWTLERNLRIAIQAQGSCSALGPTAGGSIGAPPAPVCTGDSVRTQPLPMVNATLAVQPSQRWIENYVIVSPETLGTDLVPRPSLAFFGNQMPGLRLEGGSALTLQPNSIVEMTGVGSTAVALTGSGNQVTVAGEIRAYGAGTTAIGETGGETGQTGSSSIGQGAAPAGSGNRIVLLPGGRAQGDVVMAGIGNAVHIDGTIVGNLVLQPGSSTLVTGGGTITGTIIGGGALAAGSDLSSLKVGNRPTARLARREGPGRPTRIIGVPW